MCRRTFMIYMGSLTRGCVAPACFFRVWGWGWLYPRNVDYLSHLTLRCGLQSFLMPSFLIASVSNLAISRLQAVLEFVRLFNAVILIREKSFI